MLSSIRLVLLVLVLLLGLASEGREGLTEG